MGPRERWNAALARQLGRPSGLMGRLIGRVLNRGNRATVAGAVEALELAAGSVVADIGFGGGVGLRILLDRPEVESVVGVDISAEMLAAARRRFDTELERGELRLEAGSLTEMPLADDSIDAAITVNTMYFVDDLDAAMGELARVLRPAGRVVIGVGDPAVMEEMSFTAHGFRRRPIADLEAALAAAGLQFVDHLEMGDGERPAHLLVAAAP